MSARELREQAQRWVRFAREDLDAAAAHLGLDRFVPRHVCWLAQQAAEKSLKGGLVSLGTEFPYRHDLDALRNLLPADWRVRSEFPDLAELTEWAVEARYPGEWPEATGAEAQRALAQAKGVYEAVLADLALD